MQELSVGDSKTGLILDGMDGTPWIAAALTRSELGGVVVEVPFISGQKMDQFNQVDDWFRGHGQPRNLGLAADKGTYTLIGCHYSQAVRHNANGLSIGRITPHLTVCAMREGNLEEPLVLEKMRSRLDGLQDWTDATSFLADIDTDIQEPRQTITINFPDVSPFSWLQGAAMMSIDAKSGWESSHRAFTIQDHIFLTSSFESPVSFNEHLDAQRKVAALLSLLNGEPCYFRGHEISDPQFPEKFINGKVAYVPFHPAISRDTFRESQRAEPDKNSFRFSIASLQAVGPDGLKKWSSVLEDWKRAVDPLVALHRRQTTFEDGYISAHLSLEASGHLLGKVHGESETYRGQKPTTSTFIFRCLSQLPADWSVCAESAGGLSRALANLYNGIKHFDRMSNPDLKYLQSLTHLAILVARLVIVKQVVPAVGTGESPIARRLLSQALSAIADGGFFLSEDGQNTGKATLPPA